MYAQKRIQSCMWNVFLKNHREWKLKNISRHLMKIRIDLKIIEGEEMTSLFRNIKRSNTITVVYFDNIKYSVIGYS